MSKRKQGMHKASGDRMTDGERETLGIAWNGCIHRCRRISLRHFARIHGVAHETWRRERCRGAAHGPIRDGNRWIHAEYDLEKAREPVRAGKANMGARMKLTVGMAILPRRFVLEPRRSPYDARQGIMEAFPGRDVPCLRPFYDHIEAGDRGVFRGQTPNHPGRRRTRRGNSATSRWTP